MDRQHPSRGNAAEVFLAFLKLGLTSFGGPIAHLGYFRDEFVVRRRWLDDHAYADLVALCQFLPGPASSQVGFAIGMIRAGWAGALAAFIAFTLPSALIMLAFAMSAWSLTGPAAGGALHGLKIVAVAIVAQAVWGMARNLCPDRERATIALLAVIVLAFVPSAIGMFVAIAAGATVGFALGLGKVMPQGTELPLPFSKSTATAALVAFFALLALLPVLSTQSHALAVFNSFYLAGAMVFGGGHVVLPLLDAQVVQQGWVSPDAFLAGYGAAQAVPGPLFTFAAYLGAVLGSEPNGISGACIALAAIFLPGFLLLIAVMPFWHQFRSAAAAQSLMRGANAAVVGILAAALYAPVSTTAIADLRDFSLALAGFVALTAWNAPPWIVVALSALAGMALAALG
ncbi:MAG: chromate efflux transporter [Rhizobiaceae bacterium]|nr:chromate efflux transporter [Rhizobiaceae bacterium]